MSVLLDTSSLRRLILAASLGAVMLGGVAAAQSCDTACYSDDDFGACDSLDRDGTCNANRPHQRGTVGSLFRWSAGPGAGELPQPDSPLVSNRPSFTAASSVVGLGVFQIESGYQYTSDDGGGQRKHSSTYPNTQFRYGVFANWLELQCAFDFTSQSINGIDSTSANDLALGFKFGLTPQDHWRPQMALISQMNVGVDRGAGANEDVLPGINWIYSWSIGDSLAVTGSSQFNRAIDGVTDETYNQWAQSGVASYSLSDRASSFGEFYGLYPSNADTAGAQHYFDAGFLYLLSDNVQWDIRGGLGLNDRADDYFAGSGLTVRFR
ncbi:transporter [Allorhodopirellula solitaria]|uniref:transporter n=1 Tax=Allorhodopirellula solitaria TaxID=2527987 RepID=UPI00164400EB|nr:transporter [Allorhodopirellula solitaria]